MLRLTLLLFYSIPFAAKTNLQQGMALMTRENEIVPQLNRTNSLVKFCLVQKDFRLIMNFLPDEYPNLVLTSKVLLLKYLDIYAATIWPKKGVVNLVFTPDDILDLAVSRLLFRQRFEPEVAARPNSFYNVYLQHLRNSLDPKKKLEPLPLNETLSFGNIIPTKTLARINQLHEKIRKADEHSKLRDDILTVIFDTVAETLLCVIIAMRMPCFIMCFDLYTKNWCRRTMVPGEFILLFVSIFFSILSLTFSFKVFYPLYRCKMARQESKMLQKKFLKFKF